MELIKIILILLTSVNISTQLGSYIYLPNKLIQEEIPIGSLITDLSEEIVAYNSNNNMKNEYLIDSNENQHFTFLDDVKSSTENTYFLLDSVTGRVTSKRYLDRESMCINKHCVNNCDLGVSLSLLNSTGAGNCVMNIKILVIPSYSIASLNIIVQDINDNKPQFRIESMTQSIPENVPIGHKIPLDLAYDPDIGTNSIQSYNLLQQINTFQLVQNLNESHLSLVVRQALDREVTRQYNLTISACDGGTPINCGQLKLTLNLIDINDNNPIFEKDLYSFTIDENQPINTEIGEVRAFDLDDGLNSKIRYTLLNNPSNYFNLNQDSGVLSLNTALDYEKEQYFSLNVEAKDSGVGSLPAYATIEIYVNDLNDNSPEISVSFLNTFHRNTSSPQALNNSDVSNLNVYLNENIEANKFIAHVSIADRDSSQNSRLQWKVYVNEKELKLPSVVERDDSNDLLRINKLNSNSFTINTGQKSNLLFDREIFTSINISIKGDDGLNTAFYNFSLVLLDENDNSPKFDRDLYELNINENNHIDQLIHKFNAVDPDLAENGQVFYSLEAIENNSSKRINTSVDFVYIEPLTGYLRASRVFDREQVSVYEFLIVARDNAKVIEGRKITKSKCRLNIIDLNDNKPIIIFDSSKLRYREYSNSTNLILRLDENVAPMTQLVKFDCNDADSIENSQTKFILINTIEHVPNSAEYLNSNDISPFKITQDGKLYVSKQLDRELQDFYEFKIICHDHAPEASRLNTTLSLIIRLSDVNDNCPRNLEKNRLKPTRTQFINIDHFNETSVLFDEYYTDDDIGQNAHISFELETYLDIFELNIRDSGLSSTNQIVYNVKMTLKNQTMDRKLGKYVIKLKISDMGNPSCIKNDVFILYIGNNEFNNESILVSELNSGKFESFVNDQDDVSESLQDFEYESTNDGLKIEINNPSSNSNLPNERMFKSFAFSSFKKNDFIAIIGLISSMILVALVLTLIGLIFFCKNVQRTKKKRPIDLLKVRNYREIELNSSGRSTSSSQNDDERHSEENNLLEADINRLSLSLKSSDQSQSADSVVSNITFARDSGNTSSNSSQVGDNINLREFYQNRNTNNINTISSRIYDDSSSTMTRMQSRKPNENNFKNQPHMSSFPQRSNNIQNKRIYNPNFVSSSQSTASTYSASFTPSSSESGDIIVIPTSFTSSVCSDTSETHNHSHFTRIQAPLIMHKRAVNLADKEEDEEDCLYAQNSGYFSLASNENSTLNRNSLSTNNSTNFLRSSAV